MAGIRLVGQGVLSSTVVVQPSLVYWRQKLVNDTSKNTQSTTGFTTVIPAHSASTEKRNITNLTVSLPGGTISIAGVNADNVALLGDVLRQL